MKKEELYEVLDWIEENEVRIANAISGIIYELADDVDFRERIAKGISLIASDVEEWIKEWR